MTRDGGFIRVPAARLALLGYVLFEKLVGLLVSEGSEFAGGFVVVVCAGVPFLGVGCCAEFLAGGCGGKGSLGGGTRVEVAERTASAGHGEDVVVVGCLSSAEMHWTEVMSRCPRGKLSAESQHRPHSICPSYCDDISVSLY